MTLSPQDRDLLKRIIIERYNEAVEKVPLPSGPFGFLDNARRSMQENILRSRLRPLPEMLTMIPAQLEKYTLRDLKDTLLDLYHRKEIPIP